jgi:hypothetical protein
MIILEKLNLIFWGSTKLMKKIYYKHKGIDELIFINIHFLLIDLIFSFLISKAIINSLFAMLISVLLALLKNS